MRAQVRVRVDVNSGGSKGGARDAIGGANSFNFMQFFGNFNKIVCRRPLGLAPPPRGNPGSATGK